MNAKLKQGFTMIELLVVIAIIGILAAAMIPKVGSMMLNGKMTGMMSNGRNILTAMRAAENSDLYQDVVWPSDTAADYAPETKPSGRPDLWQVFSSTEDYFTQALLMSETDGDKRNRYKVLADVTPEMLIAEGYSVATSTTINSRNCAWVLAKNARDVNGSAPVLVSKNMDTDQLIGLAGNDASTDAETMLKTNKPFGQDGCVVINRDGSAKSYVARDLNARTVLGALGSAKLSDHEEDGNAFAFLSSGSSGN